MATIPQTHHSGEVVKGYEVDVTFSPTVYSFTVYSLHLLSNTSGETLLKLSFAIKQVKHD